MPGTRLYGPVPATGNAGAVAANVSGAANPLLPATQTVLSSTAETQIVNPQLPTTPLTVAVPPGGLLEAIPFTIVASGKINTGTSSTVTLSLYSGNSATIGSNTLLKASSAFTGFAGKKNFWIKGRAIYDSVSGTLTGTVEFFLNNTLQAAAAFANVPTGISNSANPGPVLNLSLTVTFGTGGTQVVTVQDFAIYDTL